ncbi:hypothetical protein Pmi06nite_48380 [Planotetraspora mira]|uniref:Uncharacterized protein n=1 Tax=Planotetraspora mira TaxID=58121 RepID=A0A8J3TSL6_9ACTN|nr:hypothetical protein Pmi06nite_48380 [Planotetraspora mira]
MCSTSKGRMRGEGAEDACARRREAGRGEFGAQRIGKTVGGDRGMARFLPVCSRGTISKLSF